MTIQTELQVKRKRSAVGSSIQRIDSMFKTTGRTIYTRDMRLQQMLIARIKRCPYPHARIVSMDVSEALEMPGVRAVITGRDFPKPPNEDTPPLAIERALYANQAVAAVAADSQHVAEAALEKITVQYEELPYVTDPELAMSKDAPALIRSSIEPNLSNVGAHVRLRCGDVDEGFAKADYIVENRYSTQMESHMQLEPVSFLAQPDADGGLTIWGTAHGAHKLQFEVAACLGLDHSMVRTRICLLGGWFGSKEEAHVASICGMLALKTLRPVKLDLSREETLNATGARHPSIIHMKDGVSETGKIVAREVRAVYNGGAYGSLGNALLKRALLAAAGTYKLPNLLIDAYRVYTNLIPGTPKRSPIGYQMIWAVESQMEMDATTIGMDPIEFRLRNVLREGDINALGETMESISHEKALLEVAGAIKYDRRGTTEGEWKIGKGVALAAKWAGVGIHQAMVKVRENGKLEVWVDAVENGQGIYTGLAQIAAQEFGVSVEDVIMHPLVDGADSSISGLSEGASASRQLVNLGGAIILACNDLKRQIAEIASKKFNVSPRSLEVSSGYINIRDQPSRSIELSELFTKALKVGYNAGGHAVEDNELVGFGSIHKQEAPADPDTGRAIGGKISPYYVSVAQAAEVTVNIDTGQVKVNRIAAAHDAGKAINPELVRNQIIGAVMMGLSAAVSEELVVENGRVSNTNLADYKILTAVDVPMIEPIIIENPYKDGPYGAKSVGEPSILPTPAAVRNAVHDAVGIWINDLPITPEKVLNAIRDSKKLG